MGRTARTVFAFGKRTVNPPCVAAAAAPSRPTLPPTADTTVTTNMIKVIAYNKSASFEYFIEEKYEAGVVLEGSEVKSLRAGRASLAESFCELRSGEVYLKNMHIALYDKSGAFSTRDSRKERKLLLHKGEIAKISGKVNARGYTLVPLRLYFKDALIKVEIALCKGKHTYDKKQALADRDAKRAADRAVKEIFR